MLKTGLMPFNLQMFAAEGPGEGSGSTGTQTQQQSQTTQQQNQQPGQGVQIDYAKIQQMLDGTLAAKEDTALKAYFKQQGLSQQEAEQAMAAFKEQKAANQPDVAALQSKLSQAQAAAQQAQLEAAATMAAVQLGIDAKTVPFVLKLADFGKAVGQDGKISDKELTDALNKVLEAVPAFKPQASGHTGFIRVGAAGSSGQGSAGNEPLTLKGAISEALKR